MKTRVRYKIIGIMSGSSLDGVDMACCTFVNQRGKWKYTILAADTIPYTKEWKEKLIGVPSASAEAFVEMDFRYGHYLGKLCNRFMRKHKITGVDAVASHGHTVFHKPAKGYTWQLGNGSALASELDCKVIYDFRSLDIASGGEGAPLVPGGEQFLFRAYDSCLNIGGIANISFLRGKSARAFDVCYANMGLNFLASHDGKSYDKNGSIARSGTVNTQLLNFLEEAYRANRRRRPSLDRSDFDLTIKPLLEDSRVSLPDRMATFVESITVAVAQSLPAGSKGLSILCTGGGVFNNFLMARLKEQLSGKATLVVPEPMVIKFKEALIFAFLGLRRLLELPNVLASVTHAPTDSSSGAVVLGSRK